MANATQHNGRKRSPEERKATAEAGLRRIAALLKVVSEEPSLSLYLAIEIWNVLESPSRIAGLKGREFYSPSMYKDGEKKKLVLPLVGFSISKEPLGISFRPILAELGEGMCYETIAFQDWWKREVVHQPMRSPDDKDEIDPVELTRFGVVRNVRNKLAAHHDVILPRLVDELERSSVISGWTFGIAEKKHRLEDGVFEVHYPYVYAVLQQIGFELLKAMNIEVVYDRKPERIRSIRFPRD